MEYPLVSVIIPAYNAARYLLQALGSALAQTYPHLEVVVVDDGSTDETPRLVEAVAAADPRVRLLRQPNAGVAAARNLAITHARGTYIAPLDADDYWYQGKLEAQVQRMERGGEAMGVVYCWWVSLNEGGEQRAAIPWTIEGDVFEPLLFTNFIGNASVPLFRRSALDAVGLYDPGLRAQGGQGCEDWDLSLRIAERFDVGLTKGYYAAYRRAPGGMSYDDRQMARSYELVMERVRQRHPEVPPHLFRWSKGRFYLYLTGICFNRGRHRRALRWLTEAATADPAVLLFPWAAKVAGLSVARIALGSLARRLRPRPMPLDGPAPAAPPVAPAPDVAGSPHEAPAEAAIPAAPPWGRHWPFRRIQAARWRRLVGRARHRSYAEPLVSHEGSS